MTIEMRSDLFCKFVDPHHEGFREEIGTIASEWTESAENKYIECSEMRTEASSSEEEFALYHEAGLFIDATDVSRGIHAYTKDFNSKQFGKIVVCMNSSEENIQGIAIFTLHRIRGYLTLSYLMTHPRNLRGKVNEADPLSIRGVGTAMIIAIAKWAFQRDLRGIYLESSTAAIDFYHKWGFEFTEEADLVLNPGTYSMILTKERIEKLARPTLQFIAITGGDTEILETIKITTEYWEKIALAKVRMAKIAQLKKEIDLFLDSESTSILIKYNAKDLQSEKMLACRDSLLGKIQGIVTFFLNSQIPDREETYPGAYLKISCIAVDPRNIRSPLNQRESIGFKGVGKALMIEASKQALEADLAGIYLDAYHSAIPFYERCGFVIIEDDLFCPKMVLTKAKMAELVDLRKEEAAAASS